MRFELSSSRYHSVLLILAVFMASMVMATLSMHFLLRMIGIALVLIGGLYLFCQSKHHICLQYERDGSWCLIKDEVEYEGVLRGESIVTSFVSILRFNVGQSVQSCVIFSDALEKEVYRQLLVILRMG
ncbi:MAG: hypothetical protein ACD_45C00055G0004 [uncultured bacterium]|nr:MAG: hypothetical protein ACD_45C00055G0004 [uncultured bacterium]OGT58702.1 MAG: hypothetical protein A3F43_06785 [Gammaproteobacteria bacterium RIFCSPHIGHO2_12_FULL_42_10]